MTQPRYKVTYQDGSERTVQQTPLAEFLAEEKFGGIIGNQEAAGRIAYFLAWRSLHQAGQEPAQFEAWLEKISELENVTPVSTIRDQVTGILIRAQVADTDEAEEILNLADQLDKLES